MDHIGKCFCKFQIRLTSFTPDHVGVFGISQTTRDRLLQTWFGFVEAFNCALACAKRLVVGVHIRSQQISGFSIGNAMGIATMQSSGIMEMARPRLSKSSLSIASTIANRKP